MVYPWITITIYFVLSALLLQPMMKLLRRIGAVAANYQGRSIPTRSGLYVWILLWLYMLFLPARPPAYIPYVLALTAVCTAGWLDDTFGGTEAKGLRGHLRYSWKHKRPTTGLMKVAVIGSSALCLSWYRAEHGGEILTHTLLIALSTNTANLLDVRPGRTLKFFFILSILLLTIISSTGEVDMIYWIPILWGGLLLFPGDVRGRWMLGDTGANLVGFALGFWMTLTPLGVQWLALALFIALHWVAEKTSITKLIEQNRILQRVDRWGRTDP